MEHFNEVLKDSGVKLSFTDAPNVLKREQALVIRDIEKKLQSNLLHEDNVREFIVGLKQLCKSDDSFQKALLSCQLMKTDDTTLENSIKQDSLFRLLLNIGCIQKQTMEILLDSLTLHCSEEDANWVLQILNALKYLPYIKEPGKFKKKKIPFLTYIIINAGTLSRKLLDALEMATYISQLEILNAIPEIIPDGQYDEIAKELSKFLNDNLNLPSTITGAVINSLNLMTISKNVRMDIQDCILSKLFSEEYYNIFPIVYEFLITDAEVQMLPSLLLKVRNVADTIMSCSKMDNDSETVKLVLLNKLKFSAMSSKSIYEAWITLISNIKVASDHKPVDLLILFVLCSRSGLKRKNVEILLKKKVKSGLFKISLLETFCTGYLTQQVVKDYLTTFNNLASFLLQNSQELHAIEFALEFYKLLFKNPHMDYIQHQELIYTLLFLTNEKSSYILKTFLELIEHDSQKLQRYVRLLMSLLEKLDIFVLKDVQLIFELLCGLTCTDNTGLKDEIHMLIRKQVSSCLKPVKHRGIVAAVVMAKHIAMVDNDQSDITIDKEASFSISDLPDNNSKEAATLLDLVNVSTANCPESLGLYYDQLATMLITSKYLDKYFLAWLLEMITNKFENTFVTDIAPTAINDLELAVRYSINSDSEVEVPISVNIGELVLKNDPDILILSPLFRLLRLLHYKHNNGDLSTIDALLGCGVVMPDPDYVTTMDSDQVKQTADCIFHCINWFRENVNGFVTQRSPQLRCKLITRLGNLIELEELLTKCMEIVPEHKLPVSHFDSLQIHKNVVAKVENRGVKRLKKTPKSNEIINDTTASTAATTQTVKSGSSNASKDSKAYSFREMDTDIIKLLRYPVKINETANPSQECEMFDLKQFCFLLKDLTVKLEQLIKNKRTGFFLNLVNTDDVIRDVQQFLPNINACFQALTHKINEMLAETDGQRDMPDFFTPQATEIKYAFSLILYFFSVFFSWSGFQNSKHLNLLRDALKSMRGEQATQLSSSKALLADFAGKLFKSVEACIHLTAAVSLVKTMQAVYTINNNPDVNKMIVAGSGKILKKKWYTEQAKIDTGKTYNSNIDILLKAYLGGASVRTICGLVGTLQKQAPELHSKHDSLQMLASIDKSCFHILFRGLCNALQDRIGTEIASLTSEEHLVLWRTTALTLQGLMSIVKLHESKTNLLCYLKKSVKVLKVFLHQGVPILEIMLRSKPDEVVEILKTMQTSTRFLHHVCCHAKHTKDMALLAHVPQFRLTLETLIYRVKAALVANNCSDAFWMGNLKNKDLHGEEILTQNSSSTEGEMNNEEDLVEDDSDEEMEVEEGNSDSTSLSEII